MTTHRLQIEVVDGDDLAGFKKGVTSALKKLPKEGRLLSVQALPTRIEERGKVIPLDIFYEAAEAEEKPKLFRRRKRKAG